MKKILLRASFVAVCLSGLSVHAASPEQILKNILNGYLPQLNESLSPSSPHTFDRPTTCMVGTTLYFCSSDATHGSELWKSNGTAAGTVLVKDVVAGSRGSYPSYLTAVGNMLFFFANDANDVKGLWKSDGSAAGTVLVKDTITSTSHISYELSAVGDTLYFVSDDAINGSELWKSDGTAAGTILVKDIFPGSGSSYPRSLTSYGNMIYFFAYDASGVKGLWKSDGTVAGTVLVRDTIINLLDKLISIGSTLYFTQGPNDNELWKSDGTAAGTTFVKGIIVRSLITAGDALFFFSYDGYNLDAEELWKSDGTAEGTVLVKDVKNINIDWNSMTAVGNTLFFATRHTNFPELWKSDGTERGTVLVKTITGPYNNTTVLSTVGNTLFFNISDYNNGHEVWKSDGSTAGTTTIGDLSANSIGNTPFLLAFATTMQFYLDQIFSQKLSGLHPELHFLPIPPVSDVGDQTVVSGFSTAALPFTVWPFSVWPLLPEVFPDYDRFPVSVTSSDQSLVRDSDIILGGTGRFRTVTVKSAANVRGTAIITLTVSNGNSTTDIATETFALTINPGKRQNFAVKFAPNGKPVTDGHAMRQFGSVKRTHKAGVVRNLTLTNTGTKPLTGLKILKDGEAAADFIIKGFNRKPLAPHKSITFDVVFRPRNKGNRQAVIHVFSSETPDNPFDLTLAGSGVAAPKKRE